MAMTSRVAVVGAGISGLATAHELRCAGVEAVVLEAGDRAGGKIDSTRIGGVSVDTGPDGFVARDTAAAQLCRRLGLGSELVSPASRGAFVWVNGRLRPLPARSVLGVPWTADALRGTGIVSQAAANRLAVGLAQSTDPLPGDASVGEALRPRVGDEVFERLIDPLLGGINAGSADEMSIEACAPRLYEAVRTAGPLGAALEQVAASQGGDGHPRSPPPVFQSVRGGVTRIVDALADELGDTVSLSTPVQSLRRAASSGDRRWRMTTADGDVDADGVVLACPAWEAARLLEPLAPEAAEILGEIEYSDVVMAVFAIPSARLTRPLDGSGFLVPRNQGLLTTACSWASAKWRHYHHDDLAVLRVSAGRTDDRRWLDLSEDDLITTLASELAETSMISAPDATQRRFEVRITPWLRSLPQYRPGHRQRVAAVDACLAAETPGLVATGAALRGVGLPACIHAARQAATAVTGST